MNALKPFGEIDTLSYYSQTARFLEKFLKGKEIAAKNWLPGRFLIKRGSQEQPLYAEDFREVDEAFLKKRVGTALKDAKGLTPTQQKIWRYFLPRKLNDFFYATNGENPGKPLERVFFDFDRGKGAPAEEALAALTALIECVKKDERTKKWARLSTWTGNSFHLFLFPPKPLGAGEYALFKDEKGSLTRKWVGEMKLPFLSLGHEKTKGIVLDPSQTPSGKLCRAPFSLHMRDWRTVDGVCLPLNESQLEEKSIIKHLQNQTPESVLCDIRTWAENLPKLFS